MKFGDHIKVKIDLFYHHGIFISDDEVIHFCSDGKFSILSKNLEIQATSLEVFSQGKSVQVVEHNYRYSHEKTVELARESVGNTDYDLLYNNCEHFVNRCISGENRSKTMEELSNKVIQKKSNYGINGLLYNLTNVLEIGEDSNGWFQRNN